MSPIEALQEFFGFNKFKGDQEKIIKSVLNGTDTFVIMPTGGGKSLCYQLPAIMSEGVAIIISAPGQPAVTLSLGRPNANHPSTPAAADWDAHFAWLKTQPKSKTNPVDELRAHEQR